jgi:hypothetical protein
LSGSHIVEADEIQKDNNLTLLAKEATVTINKRGLYRFDLDQNRLKVFEGTASVEKDGQTILVGAGKMVALSGSGTVEKFDKEATDALDRWAKRRAEQLAMANPSTAKQMHDYGCAGRSFAAVNGPTNPCSNPCGGWRWNPWYGLVTYIPCSANIYSPYGWRYYSPYNVMGVYYRPPAPVYHPGFNPGSTFPSYNSIGQTSSGYSGTMSTTSTSPATSAAPASSGTTSAGAAGSASGGHGGGGRGR